MTGAAPSSEKEAIAELRYLAERMRGDRWLVESDDGGTHLISFRGNGGTAILATFHADASKHEIQLMKLAIETVFRFLAMIDRATARVRQLEAMIAGQGPAETKKADYTTQAAMLLLDPVFWRFLEMRGAGGPIRNKEAADEKLKILISITSKKQLNEDEEARRAWRDLAAAFEGWKRAGR